MLNDRGVKHYILKSTTDEVTLLELTINTIKFHIKKHILI